MTLLKVLKSKAWDAVPVAGFALIALCEGHAYWVGGVLTVVWLFTIAVRNI